MNHLETKAGLRDWLADLRLAHLAEAFMAGGWRGEKLLELTREELADLGVPKDQRGAVMLAVAALRQGDAPPTLPESQAPTYAPALTEAAIARCQALGQQPPVPWVETVADTWPGPIAHEYQRLRQLLEQGQIVAAIFQLKDLAEVLVKFPALVVARDLIAHGDLEAAQAARRGLFGGLLSFGHWVDGIVGRQLVPQMMRLAPTGRLLLLRQLEKTLTSPAGATADAVDAGSKPWEFARRVILTLAAAEQADVAYQEMLPASVREEVFRGVPLEILAALLDEPGRTVRLTFTLYSLKGILTAWKGEDARDARYALGLKDFVATVEALWPEALTDTHRLLATQTLEALEGRWESVSDDDLLDRWRLQYLVAYVECAEEPVYWERLIEDAAIRVAYCRLGMQAHSGALYALATQYWSILLAVAQQRVLLQPGDDAMNDLVVAYVNRGNARRAGQDLRGALEDYEQAIRLMEALRRQLGTEWPLAWANDLAQAYVNRGVTRCDGQDLSGALADFGRAIELREALRRQLGTEWPPAWANELATAYLNRGMTRRAGQDLSGALADYGRAIKLMEPLRRQLGTEWPPAWANDLARVYVNRGSAHSDSQHLSGALTDYGQAIGLMEALRRQLGKEWPPTWAINLADVYMNRGITLEDSDRLEDAVTDWDRAAKIYLN